MSRLLLSFLPCLIIGIGCKKARPSEALPPAAAPRSTTAELRILNATVWPFNDCTIDPSGTLSDNPGPNACNFGRVDSGGKTGYRTFAVLYQYSWVRLMMNSKTYYLKPYDYTGEKPLDSGRYTYKLTYTSANDRLGITLIKD